MRNRGRGCKRRQDSRHIAASDLLCRAREVAAQAIGAPGIAWSVAEANWEQAREQPAAAEVSAGRSHDPRCTDFRQF